MTSAKDSAIGRLLTEIIASVENSLIGYNDGPARLLFSACNMDQLASSFQKRHAVDVDVDRFLLGVAAFANPAIVKPVTCEDFYMFGLLVNSLVTAAPLIRQYNDALAQDLGARTRWPHIIFISCPIAWARDRYMAHLARCVDYDAAENDIYEDSAYTNHLE